MIAWAPLQRVIGSLVKLIKPQLEVCEYFNFPQLDQHAVVEVFWVEDLVVVGILVEFNKFRLQLDLAKVNNDRICLPLDYRALT